MTPPPLDTDRQLAMFRVKEHSATAMRQPTALFDALRSSPLEILAIQKHSTDEAFLISPEVMHLLIEVMQGRSRVLYVPIVDFEEAPPKVVIASLKPARPEELCWDVLVDAHPYTLTLSQHAARDMSARDARQLLWLHHPDVALKIITTHQDQS